MKSAIIQKIFLFGILSGVIALMLAFVGFGVVEFYKIRHESVAKLNSQMDVLAYSLQPTLVFDDQDAAEKTLLALQDDESINRVRLYKPDGREFASYIRLDENGNIHLAKTIFFEGRPIGRLEIDAVYLGIVDRYVTYFFISLIIIVVSIPAYYVFSAPIRAQVAEGVVQLEQQSNRLRQLADQVSATEQKERKRIASIIHDHLQQLLVASKLHLALSLKEMEKGDYEKMNSGLRRSEGFIDEALRAAKSLTVELRPPVLYEDGLEAAFQWLANKFKKEHNLEVVLNMGELPVVLSDNLKIMIFESAKELLFNVVKYAGVQKAELALKFEDGAIVIIVKDEGKGFNVGRIENASSEKGFGLFSIRERLKLLNGDFKVFSKPNEGTEVRLSFPIDMQTSRMVEPNVAHVKSEASAAAKSKTIKILLADDHRIVREGIANILKANPLFTVVAQAENGVEAVQKAGSYLPDVIIMDVNMPKLNGIEATREIKNKYPQIDIIGLSVQDEPDVEESMKKAGALMLLNKAGDPQELTQVIMASVGKANG